MEREAWWSGRIARNLTIILLALQLGTCAVDLGTRQRSLMSLLCMVTIPDNPLVEWSSLVAWFVLSLSWILGLVALKYSSLRALHWTMVLLIPVAFIGQASLVDNKIMFCDGP